jgi:hypothetical protein
MTTYARRVARRRYHGKRDPFDIDLIYGAIDDTVTLDLIRQQYPYSDLGRGSPVFINLRDNPTSYQPILDALEGD